MTDELRVVDEDVLIRDATPEDLVALVGRDLGFEPYDGAELLEVLPLAPTPEGHARFRHRWASAASDPVDIVSEVFVSRPPHHYAVRSSDAFGQVIRYDYVLTSRGDDTEFRLRAALEHESSLPRSRYAGRWSNDRLMERAVGAQLGRVRHEFELLRRTPRP